MATCSSLFIGVKLTIFFKRSFRWREHFFSRLRLNSAVFGAESLVIADDNSSNSYGLGYHEHVFDHV